MKNLFRFLVGMVVVAVLVAFTPSISLAEQVKKGDFIILKGENGIVSVKNLKSIKNTNKTFFYDDKCRIRDGGKVVVIGEAQINRYLDTILLVSYQIAGKQKGNNCPSGTIFFFGKSNFNMIKEEKDDEDEEKDIVKKLLRNN